MVLSTVRFRQHEKSLMTSALNADFDEFHGASRTSQTAKGSKESLQIAEEVVQFCTDKLNISSLKVHNHYFVRSTSNYSMDWHADALPDISLCCIYYLTDHGEIHFNNQKIKCSPGLLCIFSPDEMHMVPVCTDTRLFARFDLSNVTESVDKN